MIPAVPQLPQPFNTNPRASGGDPATGESDLQNYYDVIEEKQENELRPIYDKLLPVIMMSAFGGVPDDFDYEFNPVRRAPEDEMADLASKNTDSVTKAFQAGLISQKVALKELRQQSELTGMWTNIGDEDIEKADDEVMSPDEGMGDMMSMLGSGKEEPQEEPAEPKESEAMDSSPFEYAADAANDNWKNLIRDPKTGKWLAGGAGSKSYANKKKAGQSVQKSSKRNNKNSMSKSEYAGLMHAVMTDMTREQRKKSHINKYYGNAMYVLEKVDDGIYNVLYKVNLSWI